MFSFYSVLLDLIKARTHKYIRRIPVGATKTGATKYRYFYQGQEGHGKGIAHESELVVGASFVFSSGENKYHAHITKIDGDMITVKHDDGAKKGTEHIYTKEAFQKLVRDEHREALKQAHQKASKQLAEFEKMKASGAKVKQETLDRLKAQVDKMKFAEPPKRQEQPKEEIYDADLKPKIDTSLQSKIERLDSFQGFSSSIKELGEIIDKRFGKQLTPALLKNALKPSAAIISLAGDSNENLLNQYMEQLSNPGFAKRHSVAWKTMDLVVKETITKSFLNEILQETLTRLNAGESEKQIDAALKKKASDALGQKLKSLLDEPTLKIGKTQALKNLTQMPASDVFKVLSTFRDVDVQRLDSVFLDTDDKALTATDGACAIVVKNPKGITFPETSQLQESLFRIDNDKLKTFVKDKKQEISLSIDDTVRGADAADLVKHVSHMFNKQAYNLPIDDNIRTLLMSIKKDSAQDDLVITFEVDKDTNKCNIASYKGGDDENVLSIGSFDVQRNEKSDLPVSSKVRISLERLQKMLPFTTNVNFGEATGVISLSGADEQTQMLLMPRRA